MYALVKDRQFVKWVNLKQDFPHISFPAIPSDNDLPDGIVRVYETNPPATNINEIYKLCEEPKLINNKWYQYWTVEEISNNISLQIDQFKELAICQIQQKLDDFARLKGYDSILSAVSYKDSVIPSYKCDGITASTLRDTTWFTFFKIIEEIEQGNRKLPKNLEEIETEFPKLEWD